MNSLKILVIEDDPDSNDALCELLRLKGLVVRAALAGAEGLRLAGSQQFGVALVDLTLPDVDGIEVGRRLALVRPRPTRLLTPVGAARKSRRPGRLRCSSDQAR